MATRPLRAKIWVAGLPLTPPAKTGLVWRIASGPFPFLEQDCTVKVGRHDVRISNPDKVFFPERGLTKGDLVNYYLDVADCVLPHLRRRLFHMALQFAQIVR